MLVFGGVEFRQRAQQGPDLEEEAPDLVETTGQAGLTRRLGSNGGGSGQVETGTQ